MQALDGVLFSQRERERRVPLESGVLLVVLILVFFIATPVRRPQAAIKQTSSPLSQRQSTLLLHTRKTR
jgi:hypothetical protein